MRMFVAFLALAVGLAACGRIPEPTGYPHSHQQKMQAGHHWDVLAADIANQINNELILNDYLDTPVYVRQTCGDENQPCKPFETTVFEESFRDLLITNLVRLGVPTSPTQGDKTLVVNYKAQLVYHHARRWRTLKPGLITALTAGVLVIRNAPSELIVLATAGAIDFANAALSSVSNFEVIITTSVVTDSNYLFRNSNIYYINDKDSWHYLTPSSPQEIRLTSATTRHDAKARIQKEPIKTEPQRPPYPPAYPEETTGI